jgi:hypothetical protein
MDNFREDLDAIVPLAEACVKLKQFQDLDKLGSALESLITMVEKLGPLCRDSGELIDLMNLARNNDGQLTLLIREMGRR